MDCEATKTISDPKLLMKAVQYLQPKNQQKKKENQKKKNTTPEEILKMIVSFFAPYS